MSQPALRSISRTLHVLPSPLVSRLPLSPPCPALPCLAPACLAQDTMGVCFMLVVLKQFFLPNLKVATILLCLAFVYGESEAWAAW